jgi:hypothetical protein
MPLSHLLVSVGCLALACSNEGDDDSDGASEATITGASGADGSSSTSGDPTSAGSTTAGTDADGDGSTTTGGGETTAADGSEGTGSGPSGTDDESSSGADGSEGGSTTGVDNPCGIDNPCPNGQACVFEEGDCGMGGVTTCEDAPQICPLDFNPVCACDFMTYANACAAYAAGQSILHPGEC